MGLAITDPRQLSKGISKLEMGIASAVGIALLFGSYYTISHLFNIELLTGTQSGYADRMQLDIITEDTDNNRKGETVLTYGNDRYNVKVDDSGRLKIEYQESR